MGETSRVKSPLRRLARYAGIGAMTLTQWIVLGSLPFVSALIGWATNKLAILMLFRPRRARRFLGIRLHGLIPRRQPQIAESVGEIVETQLLSQHVLQAEVRQINLEPYLVEYVRRLVYQRIGPRLAAIPLLGRMVNDRLLGQIESLALEEMRRESRPALERFAAEAEKHLPVRRMVEDRVRLFDMHQLEAVVYRLASREFKQIEILGGVLGFLIGLAQLILLLLSGTIS